MEEQIIHIITSESQGEEGFCFQFYALTNKGRVFERTSERVKIDSSIEKYDPYNFKTIYHWALIDLPDFNV